MTDCVFQADVLVTGGTGFLGGHLVRRLLDDGRRVRLLVRTPQALPAEIAQRCEVIQGDLANTDALSKAVAGVSLVFHCAANVKTWDRWPAYYEANVVGVQNLLQALSTSNPGLIRLVHVSTVDVYGYPALPCAEGAVTTGAGFGYGESKLMGEALVVRQCTDLNIAFTIIRPTNVIGAGSQFIDRVAHALRCGGMLQIDHGRANAGMIDVGNLVDYLVWAASAEQARGECYNARDAYDVSWAEVIATLRVALQGRTRVINLPFGFAMWLAKRTQSIWDLLGWSGEPFLHPLLVNVFGRTCGHDASKIRAHSGLVGRVGFEEAMRHSVEWLHHQNELREQRRSH